MYKKINPLGLRVVVRILPLTNKTSSGLYLPEGSREQMQESLIGIVIAVATAYEDSQEANISGVPLNSHVLIPKNAGIRIPWDDSVRIVEVKDILAVVELETYA